MTAIEDRKVDPVTFEILSHRLHEITKEMGATLERVGGTVNTTQLHDYMAALYLPNGDILSAGDSMGWHVACAGFAVKRIIERFEGEIGPDDVFLLNDPYVAAIHQSDVYIVSPIHYEEALVAWSATFVHVMDIGALSPGGNSPGATEIVHEGLRIPGIKLVEKGKLRRDVFESLTNMTRQPTMVGLDLKCEIAANNVAKTRMQELHRWYGRDLVKTVSESLLRHSETILRRRIKEIPDGQWTASAMIQADSTWRVQIRLEKHGDRLFFDFTGSDPQARTGINLPYHATFGACYESVLVTLGYDIPKNQGMFAPITVEAPAGSVMNVKYPAPVSLNTTSGGAIAKFLAFSVMAQALATSETWKREAMAQTLGGRLARHAGVNQFGTYYVSTLLENAGSGATAMKDGIDSGNGHRTCNNVEWVERNFPILYLFRRQAEDCGGPGKNRGGTGAEIALTLHKAPEKKIKGVALGVAGLTNSGNGLFGGYPGAPSLLTLYQGTKVRDVIAIKRAPISLQEIKGTGSLLPYCDFEIGEDDVLYLRASSGGGYGDPLDRSPELVRQDVKDRLISRQAAQEVYGVMLDEGSALNLDGTRMLRAKLRARRAEPSV